MATDSQLIAPGAAVSLSLGLTGIRVNSATNLPENSMSGGLVNFARRGRSISIREPISTSPVRRTWPPR